MADRKNKTFIYRRAVWLVDGQTVTLEHCLREMDRKLPTVADKTVGRAEDQVIHCAKFDPANAGGGIYLHIVTDTPGEAASVVPHTKPGAIEIKVDTSAAPANFEFMDGDAFLYVRHDDVVMCSTNIRDGGVRIFFHDLFRKAGMGNKTILFDLRPVAAVDKVKLINAEGVKEIDLRATISKAASDYSRRKHQTQTVAGAAARQVKAIFGKPNDVSKDSLSISITLKSDHRIRAGVVLGEKMLDKMALDLIKSQEDGDEFVIHTRKGQTITKSEISIQTKSSVKAQGKSVDRDQAWKRLEEFYKSLKDSGLTEQ